MSEEISAYELSTAYESLGNLRLESPSLAGSFAAIWHLIGIAYKSCLDSYDHPEIQGYLINSCSLYNIIMLTSKLIQELGSKLEIVEVIARRQKAMDSIKNIENSLRSLCIGDNALMDICLSNTKLNFIMDYDIKTSLEFLLEVKLYCEAYENEVYVEHATSMNTLIQFLVKQKISASCTSIPHITIDGLYIPSLHDLSQLFPDELMPISIEDESEEAKADKLHSKSYGTSYKAIWDGSFVAIKKIHYTNFKGQESRLLQGVFALEELQKPKANPYLNEIIGISWDKTAFYLITKLAPERSLFDVFSNPNLLPTSKAVLKPIHKVSILLDVTRGLEFLHSRGFTHGRLKDTNILLYPNMRAKLSDFVISTFLEVNELVGTHGVRWMAPELAQEEVNRQKIGKNRFFSSAPTLREVSASFPLYLSPAVDIYAVGVLGVVLLSEQLPFYNVPWDEGVKTMLLENHVPSLPYRYPNKEEVAVIDEELITPCLRPSFARPSIDGLVFVAKELFCSFQLEENQRQLVQYEKDIQSVKNEIIQIEKEIKSHQEMISGGKELINKKEKEKLRIADGKLRREREVEIDKARQKLIGFQEELEGLIDDKDGAESDLQHLIDLLENLKSDIKKGKTFPLEHRDKSFESDNQATLLEKYCEKHDFDRLFSKLTNLETFNEFYTTAPCSIDSLQNSFFTSFYQTDITQLSEEFRGRLGKSANGAKLRYHYLVDFCDLVFRLPVEAKMLKGTPCKAPGITFVSGQKVAKAIAYISDESEDESAAMRRRAKKNKEEADSDDEEEAVDTERNMTSRQKRQSRASSMRLVSKDLVARFRSTTSTHPFGTKQSVKKEETLGILVAPGIVHESEISGNSVFPSSELDIIHVQYLSAAYGNWNRSIGLRRLSQGFQDEHIAGFLDSNFSPVHLAAYLGNYDVLEQLVTTAGYSPLLADANGDTPLHCACKRGHAKIAIYLSREFQARSDELNEEGITPIQYACRGGFLEIVEHFMEEAERVVSAQFQDARVGASLLHWACLSKNPDLIDYLIGRQGIAVETVVRSDKSTGLLWACFSSTKTVVEHLIMRCNANAEVKTSFGSTCLHMAAASGDAAKTKFLVDVVRLKLTDLDGDYKTPFDVATGGAAAYLIARKKKGFVTGSIAAKDSGKEKEQQGEEKQEGNDGDDDDNNDSNEREEEKNSSATDKSKSKSKKKK